MNKITLSLSLNEAKILYKEATLEKIRIRGIISRT